MSFTYYNSSSKGLLSCSSCSLTRIAFMIKLYQVSFPATYFPSDKEVCQVVQRNLQEEMLIGSYFLALSIPVYSFSSRSLSHLTLETISLTQIFTRLNIFHSQTWRWSSIQLYDEKTRLTLARKWRIIKAKYKSTMLMHIHFLTRTSLLHVSRGESVESFTLLTYFKWDSGLFTRVYPCFHTIYNCILSNF